MPKGRLEAFSDAVIAILMTIMVLELRAPEHMDFAAFEKELPFFLTYLLSFVNLGIYWNNHHHLLQASQRVNGGILWANMHLLFWLSLFPFVTQGMQRDLSAFSVATYGVVSLLAAIAYFILQTTVVAAQPPDWPMGAALGRDIKGKVSLSCTSRASPWRASANGSPSRSTSPSPSCGSSPTGAWKPSPSTVRRPTIVLYNIFGYDLHERTKGTNVKGLAASPSALCWFRC